MEFLIILGLILGLGAIFIISSFVPSNNTEKERDDTQEEREEIYTVPYEVGDGPEEDDELDVD
ncbi:hypothetical protein BZZ01_10165 [Nostocales cyanobacterium HT-58-2]|nr:hypothetical protein BZZ01_10165 [Nostocales cyanobacterium HT-58-2]